MPQTRWERFQAESNAKDLTALVESHRPLVYSVCRRYLHDPHDVDDAAQETFLKLAKHAQFISGNLRAWLSATAHSTAIDLIRRTIRDRKSREQLNTAFPSLPPHLEYRLLDQAIKDRLHDALLALDEANRQLLIDRFFRKEPMRLIAGRQGTSIATIGRRSSQALSQLAAILEDMGVSSLDEWTLANHLGEPWNDRGEPGDPGVFAPVGDGLRFAPDWRASIRDPYAPGWRTLNTPCLPGWNRPIRVGAFVSYVAITTPAGVDYSYFQPIELHVATLGLLKHPGFDLVGIVDPGTTERGPVERTLRDFQLTAGLIDVTDLEGLKSLDVILLGDNYGIDECAASTLNQAVRSGVGLLNEHWTGLGRQTRNQVSDVRRTIYNQDVRDLMLAASPIFPFHTPGSCEVPQTATVLQQHPLLPGLSRGTVLNLLGCGPLYKVTPGTKVLITKNHVVPQEEHRIPGLGPAKLPVFGLGQLGAGRVAAVHIWGHQNLILHPALSPDYLPNLLAWLAEPRRQSA